MTQSSWPPATFAATVFNAMVDGWRAQMLARGLAVYTIKARCYGGWFVEFTNEIRGSNNRSLTKPKRHMTD